jgi:hypothetical protein
MERDLHKSGNEQIVGESTQAHDSLDSVQDFLWDMTTAPYPPVAPPDLYISPCPLIEHDFPQQFRSTR